MLAQPAQRRHQLMIMTAVLFRVYLMVARETFPLRKKENIEEKINVPLKNIRAEKDACTHRNSPCHALHRWYKVYFLSDARSHGQRCT